MLIFLGGASRAGKSHAVRRVAELTGLPFEGLDHHVSLVRKAEGLEGTARIHRGRAIAAEIIETRRALDQNALLEGWWIDPDQAAAWRDKGGVQPLFCGYPQADPEARDALLCQGSGRRGAWYRRLERAQRLAVLDRQIALSHRYQARCAALELPFVDVSDPDWGVDTLQTQLLRFVQDHVPGVTASASASVSAKEKGRSLGPARFGFTWRRA